MGWQNQQFLEVQPLQQIWFWYYIILYLFLLGFGLFSVINRLNAFYSYNHFQIVDEKHTFHFFRKYRLPANMGGEMQFYVYTERELQGLWCRHISKVKYQQITRNLGHITLLTTEKVSTFKYLQLSSSQHIELLAYFFSVVFFKICHENLAAPVWLLTCNSF